MAEIKGLIESAQNAQLKKIRKLLQSKKERDLAGRFVVEGPRMAREIPEEMLDRIYVSRSYADKLPEDYPYPVTAVADDLFEKLSDTKTPQGILAVVKTPSYDHGMLDAGGKSLHNTNTSAGVSPEAPLYLLLDDIQDPGNMGTILRSAEGAGVTAVIYGHTCADVFQPKTVRSSMGSIFRVPVIKSRDMMRTVEELKKNGIRIFASELQGSVGLYESDLKGPCGILVGNEGKGLPRPLIDLCDGRLMIPMEGQVESLNAAMAATLIIYEAWRQRRKGQ